MEHTHGLRSRRLYTKFELATSHETKSASNFFNFKLWLRVVREKERGRERVEKSNSNFGPKNEILLMHEWSNRWSYHIHHSHTGLTSELETLFFFACLLLASAGRKRIRETLELDTRKKKKKQLNKMRKGKYARAGSEREKATLKVRTKKRQLKS